MQIVNQLYLCWSLSRFPKAANERNHTPFLFKNLLSPSIIMKLSTFYTSVIASTFASQPVSSAHICGRRLKAEAEGDKTKDPFVCGGTLTGSGQTFVLPHDINCPCDTFEALEIRGLHNILNLNRNTVSCSQDSPYYAIEVYGSSNTVKNGNSKRNFLANNIL